MDRCIRHQISGESQGVEAQQGRSLPERMIETRAVLTILSLDLYPTFALDSLSDICHHSIVSQRYFGLHFAPFPIKLLSVKTTDHLCTFACALHSRSLAYAWYCLS